MKSVTWNFKRDEGVNEDEWEKNKNEKKRWKKRRRWKNFKNGNIRKKKKKRLEFEKKSLKKKCES